jgi:hypothetical protein
MTEEAIRSVLRKSSGLFLSANFAEEKEGGTMEMPTIYVSYVETAGGEGVFAYLPDIEAAATAVEARSPKTGRVTRIQKISKMVGQPAIEIICFSAEQISTERSKEISQNAVDWLMEEGHLHWHE